MTTRDNAEPLQVAVVGVGGMAHWQHLPNLVALSDRVSIAAIVDRDRDRLADAAAQYHIAHTYDSVPALLGSGLHLDGALVLTRPPQHRDPTVALMRAGVPVFCEKPLAYRLDDAEAMVATARETGTMLMVGYNRRFAAVVRVAKETLSRTTPQLLLAEKSKPTKPEVRARLLEYAVHAVDTLVWLAGSEVEQVRVEVRPEPDGTAEESLAAIVRFRAGTIGVFAMNAHGAHWVERYEAYSEDATVLVEYPVRVRRFTREPAPLSDDLAALLAAPPSDRELGLIDGEPILQLEGTLCPVDEVSALGFRAELQHFLNCIGTGATPITSGEEALKTQRLADRIYREAGLAP